MERTSTSERAGFRNHALISYFINTTATGPVRLEIHDILDKNVFATEFTPELGINRYRWDMRFDPPSLSEDQVAQFVRQARDRIQNTGDPQARQQLQNALDRFQQAPTITQQRQAAAQLSGGRGRGGGRERGRGGLFSTGVTAGPGRYVVKMIVNGETYTSTLTIRQDPLLNERK